MKKAAIFLALLTVAAFVCLGTGLCGPNLTQGETEQSDFQGTSIDEMLFNIIKDDQCRLCSF